MRYGYKAKMLNSCDSKTKVWYLGQELTKRSYSLADKRLSSTWATKSMRRCSVDLATLMSLIGAWICLCNHGNDPRWKTSGCSMTRHPFWSWLVVQRLLFTMKFTMGQFFGATKIAGKAFMFKATASLKSQPAKVVEMADAAREWFLSTWRDGNQQQLQHKGHRSIDSLAAQWWCGSCGTAKDIALTTERHGGRNAKVFSAFSDVAPAMEYDWYLGWSGCDAFEHGWSLKRSVLRWQLHFLTTLYMVRFFFRTWVFFNRRQTCIAPRSGDAKPSIGNGQCINNTFKMVKTHEWLTVTSRLLNEG